MNHHYEQQQPQHSRTASSRPSRCHILTPIASRNGGAQELRRGLAGLGPNGVDLAASERLTDAPMNRGLGRACDRAAGGPRAGKRLPKIGAAGLVGVGWPIRPTRTAAWLREGPSSSATAVGSVLSAPLPCTTPMTLYRPSSARSTRQVERGSELSSASSSSYCSTVGDCHMTSAGSTALEP